MKAVYWSTCFAVCLTLIACGNKGDLYLEEVALTEEQKALLEEVSAEKLKKKKAGSTQ